MLTAFKLSLKPIFAVTLLCWLNLFLV